MSQGIVFWIGAVIGFLIGAVYGHGKGEDEEMKRQAKMRKDKN